MFNRVSWAVLSCVSLASAVVCADGGPLTWQTTGTQDWNTATNWDPNEVPNSGSDVMVNDASSLSHHAPIISSPAEALTLLLQPDLSQSALLLQNNLTLFSADLNALTLQGNAFIEGQGENGSLTLAGSGGVTYVYDTNAATLQDFTLISSGVIPFTVDEDGASLNLIHMQIQSSGISLTGGGILYISGVTPFAYTGSTSIEHGLMEISANNLLPSTTVVDIASAGQLLFIAPVTQTIGGLSGSGQVMFNDANIQFIVNTVDNYEFSGDITQPGSLGTLEKQGLGSLTLSGTNSYDTTLVSGGTLIVNGALTNAALTVNQGAKLAGTGTITGPITYNGTLKPGNSPGTITLIGDQTFNSTSILQIDIDNTSNSKAVIHGALLTEPGVLVEVSGSPLLSQTQTYQIVTYTDLFSELFMAPPTTDMFIVQPQFPAQIFTLSDPGGEIDLTITVHFPSGEGSQKQAAAAMNQFLVSPCGNSSAVVNALAYTPTHRGLDEALQSTQPSALTSLAIAQQDAQLMVRNSIYNRLEESLHSCCARELNGQNTVNLWGAGLMEHSSQRDQHHEPGFIVNAPGMFLGADGMIGLRSTVGAGVGYTHSHLRWAHHRGEGNVQTIYLSAYGQWATPRVYLEGALTGGYSFYDADRDMKFGTSYTFNAKAHNSHKGLDGSVHLRSGLKYGCHAWVFSPFAGLDYIATHEDAFTETGANSMNLHVNSHFANLLTSEAGLDISYCWKEKDCSMAPFFKLSAIRESRFSGSKERAHFTCGEHAMTVHGLSPSRTLAGIGAGLNTTFGLNTISFAYQGKVGGHFTDTACSLEYLRKF